MIMAKVIRGKTLLKGLLADMTHISNVVLDHYGPSGGETIFEQKYDVPIITKKGSVVWNALTLEGSSGKLCWQVGWHGSTKSFF